MLQWAMRHGQGSTHVHAYPAWTARPVNLFLPLNVRSRRRQSVHYAGSHVAIPPFSSLPEVLDNFRWWWTAAYVVLYAAATVSCISTTLSDPGILPRYTLLPEAINLDSRGFDVSPDVISIEYVTNERHHPYIIGKTLVYNRGERRIHLKYCDTCMLFRPPGTSHCGNCRNCVGKCMWCVWEPALMRVL